jgi:putative protease
MRIQIGIGNREELLYYLDNGADEFYGGIERIPGHLYGGENISSESEFLKLCELVHLKNKKFFFVANEVRSDAFYDTIKTIKYLVKNGIDGVIIRDLALLNRLKEEGVKTYYILSSLALCFNRDCLGFYYKYGIKRIALPEQITVEEASDLVKNKFGIETEMFMTAREYCVVLNGFCYLKQFNGDCICRAGFDFGNSKFAMPRPSVKEHFENLYKLYKMGVDILKIGRHTDSRYIRFEFKELLALKALLESSISLENFINNAIKTNRKFGEILLRWERKK